MVSFLLGGSWLLKSRVISRATMVMTLLRVLRTQLISTHEPPSTLINDLRIYTATIRCLVRFVMTQGSTASLKELLLGAKP